ncbi:hypothetical protein DVH24_037834 [Malus domestica]|uniref:Uncharacterized protein n=1 Tax=Malus domestica TaxID=3750 RepID=A0A498JYG7_MALDO|nr:hypothetical protein DVH24_037834 [Malus domestica]
MESQIQSIVEYGEEDTYEVRTHIYIEQMGYETRNRVRGVFNGGLSLGLFSGLLSSSFDENVMRYMGAHGVLVEGFGSHGGSAEGSRAQGGLAKGSGSIEWTDMKMM